MATKDPSRWQGRSPIVVALLAAALALPACKVERRSQQSAAASARNSVDNFENAAFDQKSQVHDIWDSKVLPSLRKRAFDRQTRR